MSNIIVGITFWLVVLLIVVASLLYSYFKNLEFQKTIRFAIEKGMQLDADSIENIMRKKPDIAETISWMYISGIICFSGCIGLIILAYFITKTEPESFYPIMGAGILVGVVGVGLALSGLLLGIQEKNKDKGSQQS